MHWFSIAWGLIAALRHWLYDQGILKIYRVQVPVVCVGNIAVGGTGKTPFVIMLAKHFAKRRVAIISRGYGGGDEMRVIARHVDAKLYMDPNRVRAARKAEQEGAELILMDDGFQHRRLHRDLDVVIVRPQDYTDRYLPAGRLRDSPKRLKNVYVVEGYTTHVSCPVDLKGERVAIFCGIGSPEKFKKTVEDLGAIIVGQLFLRDHQSVSSKKLTSLYNSLDVKYLICTEKDEVKLEPSELPIYAVKMEISSVGFEDLIEKIEEKL